MVAQSELSVMSHTIGHVAENLFPCMRDNAAGAAFLSEKVHLQSARNWTWQQNLQCEDKDIFESPEFFKIILFQICLYCSLMLIVMWLIRFEYCQFIESMKTYDSIYVWNYLIKYFMSHMTTAKLALAQSHANLAVPACSTRDFRSENSCHPSLSPDIYQKTAAV